MECFRYTDFRRIAFVGLFENISNSQDLLERIQRAAKLAGPEGDRERELVKFAFIDAALITSLTHLQVALAQSLLAEADGKLRTKTIHSEIIWTLNPTNNITEALRRFGVSNGTKALILVQVSEDTPNLDASQKELAMKELVQASPVPLTKISQHTDWARVRKIYKLNEDVAIKNINDRVSVHSKINDIVTSTVATKLVQG